MRAALPLWGLLFAFSTGQLAWAGTPPVNPSSKDPSYALRLETPPAKKGQKGLAKIHIAPGAGFHMNKDYPLQITVVAPTGLAVEKPKQTAKDAVRLEEAGADFDVAYTVDAAATAGAKVVTGELKFAVCSASSCDPKREKLSFTITVN
jgi:hypothetical protein